MEKLTVVQLRHLAKERGLHGHTHLQKDKLIKFIRDAGITDEECDKEEGKNTEKITSALLRRYAWRLGLRGYAKLRKAELIKFIKDMQEVTTDEEWEEEKKRIFMMKRKVAIKP